MPFGLLPLQKWTLLLDRSPLPRFLDFGLGQRLSLVLPEAAPLAQLFDQGDCFFAVLFFHRPLFFLGSVKQGLSAQVAGTGQVVGRGHTAHPGYELIRGGQRFVDIPILGIGLEQTETGLALHLERQPLLFEEEYEVAHRPVELLQFLLAESPTEQAFVFELRALLAHGELGKALGCLFQQLFLLVSVKQRGPNVVQPVEKIERLRGHELGVFPLPALVQGFEVAVLIHHRLAQTLKTGDAAVVYLFQRATEGVIQVTHQRLLRRVGHGLG